MSDEQFEEFLTKQLIEWLRPRTVAGQRFQYRSSDNENTSLLISHFQNVASGSVDVDNTLIPFVNVGETRLLCVSHSDVSNANAGFNENYISWLRDRVAEQSDIFNQTSLLIIHNSLLDTLINSATDLAATDAPWATAAIFKIPAVKPTVT